MRRGDGAQGSCVIRFFFFFIKSLICGSEQHRWQQRSQPYEGKNRSRLSCCVRMHQLLNLLLNLITLGGTLHASAHSKNSSSAQQ